MCIDNVSIVRNNLRTIANLGHALAPHRTIEAAWEQT